MVSQHSSKLRVTVINPVRKSHEAFNRDRGGTGKKQEQTVALPRANVGKYMHLNMTIRRRMSLLSAVLQ